MSAPIVSLPTEELVTTRVKASWLKCDVLGIGFDYVDYAKVLEVVVAWRDQGLRKYISITNPHSVLVCGRDEAMRQATIRADLTVPDGVGIVWAANILGYTHYGRVTGPTLMLRLCDWGRKFGLRHFLYGGAEGVAEKLRDRLTTAYPGVIISGLCCPPFRTLSEAEDEEMVRQMNDASPDVVWVGLGAPKQEKWMLDHSGRVQAAAMIGVGAAFDFHSGRVKWAPAWMRRVGLEWAYRLGCDPKRLWKRNLDSPRFLTRVLIQRFRGKQHEIAVSVDDVR